MGMAVLTRVSGSQDGSCCAPESGSPHGRCHHQDDNDDPPSVTDRDGTVPEALDAVA